MAEVTIFKTKLCDCKHDWQSVMIVVDSFPLLILFIQQNQSCMFFSYAIFILGFTGIHPARHCANIFCQIASLLFSFFGTLRPDPGMFCISSMGKFKNVYVTIRNCKIAKLPCIAAVKTSVGSY